MADTSSTHIIKYRLQLDTTGLQAGVSTASETVSKAADNAAVAATTGAIHQPVIPVTPGQPQTAPPPDTQQPLPPTKHRVVDDENGGTDNAPKTIGQHIFSSMFTGVHSRLSSLFGKQAHPMVSHAITSYMFSHIHRHRSLRGLMSLPSSGNTKISEAAERAENAATTGEGINGTSSGESGATAIAEGGAASGLLIGGAVAVGAVVLIGVITKLVRVMNTLTNRVAKYNPQVAGHQAMYGLETRMFNINLGAALAPVALQWIKIKESVLNDVNSLLPLVKTVSSILAEFAKLEAKFNPWLNLGHIFSGLKAAAETFAFDKVKLHESTLVAGINAFAAGNKAFNKPTTLTLTQQALMWNHAFVQSLKAPAHPVKGGPANQPLLHPFGAGDNPLGHLLQQPHFPHMPSKPGPGPGPGGVSINVSSHREVFEAIEQVRSQLLMAMDESESRAQLASAIIEGRPSHWSV